MAVSSVAMEKGSTDSEGQGRKGVRALLNDFTQDTSMHGLARITSSKYLVLKLFWAALVMAAAGVAINNVVDVLNLYGTNPVSTSVSIEFDGSISFPAVSICNLNLVRQSQLDNNAMLSDLKNQQDMFYWDNYDQTTVPTVGGSSTVADFYDDYSFDYFDAEKAMEDTYAIREFMAKIDLKTRKPFGHQIEDMLVSCSYNGEECSVGNFTPVYDVDYGNCFTFNKKTEVSKVSKPGPSHGLRLLLNVEEEEYTSMTQTVGFKLLIHPQSYMPFPTDEGFIISPGFTSDVGISMLDIKRTEAPYGRCVNYGNDHDDLNMYAEYFDVGYSDKACQLTCLQKAVYRECDCCHRDFPCYLSNPDGTPIVTTVCNSTDIIASDCVAWVEKSFNSDELGCSDICLPACRETGYSHDVSTGRWPSRSREDLFVSYLSQHFCCSHKAVDIDYVRNNLAKVDIYFKTLNYQEIKTTPAYDWIRLLSDLGGQFGLWLGFSLLTAVELLQLLFDIVCCLVQRLFCKGNKKRTKPDPSRS